MSKRPRPSRTKPRRFALVLAGGGARGLAHAGALHALEQYGLRPSAIVGVSMGAIVGATYGLNPDWYRALLELDTQGFPQAPTPRDSGFRERLRALLATERVVQEMLLGWGAGSRSLAHGMRLLRELTRGLDLEAARLPLAVVATDLLSGERVVLRRGNAAEAVYASAALAGILPPRRWNGHLLADGAYADVAPVDIARELVADVVIAVNPHQPHSEPPALRNGLQALMRALEICHYQHAYLRFAEADLTLQPEFPYPIDTLDFSSLRSCVAAGKWAVRRALPQLRELLGTAADKAVR